MEILGEKFPVYGRRQGVSQSSNPCLASPLLICDSRVIVQGGERLNHNVGSVRIVSSCSTRFNDEWLALRGPLVYLYTP